MLTSVSRLAAAALAAGMALPAAGASPAQADHRWHGGGVHYHYYYRGSGGSALTAGLFGLAAGAVIGRAVAQPRVYAPPPRVVYVQPAPVHYAPAPWTPDWYAYCASKYPNFDTYSGTYIDWYGVRRYCR